MENAELVNKAFEALENAYTPYSKFNVGAALICENGNVYTGCNIENASYGASVCAERVAIFKAVSCGEVAFDKIAIVSKSDNKEFESFAGDFTFPCGICRQVMAEFRIKEIVLKGKNNSIEVYKLEELLPKAFNL